MVNIREANSERSSERILKALRRTVNEQRSIILERQVDSEGIDTKESSSEDKHNNVDYENKQRDGN